MFRPPRCCATHRRLATWSWTPCKAGGNIVHMTFIRSFPFSLNLLNSLIMACVGCIGGSDPGESDASSGGSSGAEGPGESSGLGNTGMPPMSSETGGTGVTGDAGDTGDTASGSEGSSSDTTPADMCPPDDIDDTIWNGIGCDAEVPDYIGKPLPANLAANCAASPESVEAWESAGEMTACIVGQWLACPEFPVYGVGDGVGLEFTADGQMFRLLLDEDCNVVRGMGIDHVGTWEFGDVGTGDGPNGLRYTFDPDQNGWLVTAPSITTNPEQMRTNDSGRLARP